MKLIELNPQTWFWWGNQAHPSPYPESAILVADDTGPCCCLSLKRAGAFLFAELDVSRYAEDPPQAIRIALRALRGIAMTSGSTPIVITRPQWQPALEAAGMAAAPYALMSFKKEQPQAAGKQPGATEVTAPDTTSEPSGTTLANPGRDDSDDMDGLDAIVKAGKALTSLRPDRRRSSTSPERSEPPAAPSAKPKRSRSSQPAK